MDFFAIFGVLFLCAPSLLQAQNTHSCVAAEKEGVGELGRLLYAQAGYDGGVCATVYFSYVENVCSLNLKD